MFIDARLQIAKTNNKGNGIIALKNIPAHTEIELSPAIIMTAKERKLLDKTELYNYIFVWGHNEDECCMAQGYISIYNHACPSNSEYFMNFDDNTILIKTVRNIKAGEEITINYQGDFDCEEKVWFEMK
jgi:uncharacterized protein